MRSQTTPARWVIGGIMEHIEQAGIHSGDSACSLPTISLPDAALATIRDWTVKLAKRLNVIGLMNIQFAVKGDQVYILEANPRASRTVPFVSKAIGHPPGQAGGAGHVGASPWKNWGFTNGGDPRPYCRQRSGFAL